MSHILRRQEPNPSQHKLVVWSKGLDSGDSPPQFLVPTPPSPGLTSGPFLLDLLLKDALFFFLLALRVFCKGIRDVGDWV